MVNLRICETVKRLVSFTTPFNFFSFCPLRSCSRAPRRIYTHNLYAQIPRVRFNELASLDWRIINPRICETVRRLVSFTTPSDFFSFCPLRSRSRAPRLCTISTHNFYVSDLTHFSHLNHFSSYLQFKGNQEGQEGLEISGY